MGLPGRRGAADDDDRSIDRWARPQDRLAPVDTGLSILIYAVIAAVSPLALSATLLVIRSERPRTNGIAFAAGFVLGTTIACILGRLIGDAAADGLSSHETVEDLLTLIAGCGARVLRAPGSRPAVATRRPVEQPCGRHHGEPSSRAAGSGLLDGLSARLRRPQAVAAHAAGDGRGQLHGPRLRCEPVAGRHLRRRRHAPRVAADRDGGRRRHRRPRSFSVAARPGWRHTPCSSGSGSLWDSARRWSRSRSCACSPELPGRRPESAEGENSAQGGGR